MKQYFIMLLVVLISTSAGYSQEQDLDKIPPKKILKFAEKSLEKGDVYTTINYYESYIKRVPGDYAIMYQLAEMHRKSRDYQKAMEYYKTIYENAPTLYPVALYHYANMLKYLGQYDEAYQRFKDFKKAYRGRDYAKLTENQIDGCKMALENKTKLNVDIKHQGSSINKAYIELSPAYIDNNTIVYGSLPADTVPYFQIKADEKVLIPMRKLYTAKRKKDIEWESTGLMEGPINSIDAHTVNGTFSGDGQRFYFTRCKVDWENKVKCDIWATEKDTLGKWKEPRMLPYPVNTEESSSSMPTMGVESGRKKREILYFVSDRPFKSEGGKDIWYSIFNEKDSVFDNADNPGRKINTPGDDITPYYDIATKHLYYSTEYLPGYGGFDIFKVRGEGRKWKKTYNIGSPINSSYDDLYYVINPFNRSEGFFASNRPGGAALLNPTCCDDLYTFYDKDYISLAVEGQVFEIPADKKRPPGRKLDSAIVTLYSIAMDEETGEDVMIEIMSDTTDKNGDWFLNLEKNEEYRLMFKKDGYYYKQLELTTEGKNRSDTFSFKDVQLEEISRKPTVFYIYYDVNKFELTEETTRIIDTSLYAILKETPDIIVEISSHTDDQGDSLYNINLSQKRSEKVVEYLVSKGIEHTRLIAKGYGENKPIVGNDTPEGQAKNRRTEFSVVGSKDPFSKLNTTELKIIKRRTDIEKDEDDGDKKDEKNNNPPKPPANKNNKPGGQK